MRFANKSALKFALFFSLAYLFCLNMSRAQESTPLPPLPTDLQNTAASIQPATPGATPTGTPAAPAAGEASDPSMPNPAKATKGKYSEYNSICLQNEYDLVKDYSDELKQKRIDFLKNKVSQAGPQASVYELRLIREYIDQNDYKKITPLVAEMREKQISDSQVDYLNSMVDYTKNNLAPARERMVQLVQKKPNNIEYMTFLAKIFEDQQNYFEATTIFEDLNKNTKNAFLPDQCEAMVLNSLNADGEQVCMKAFKKFPQNPIPLIYAGITLRERDDMTSAISNFEKSLTIKKTEFAYACLAEAYMIKKDLAKSIEYFKDGLALRPTSIRLILGSAWAALKQKKYDNSLSAFTDACKINSKYQSEILRAFKELNDYKIPEAKKFKQLAVSCGP